MQVAFDQQQEQPHASLPRHWRCVSDNAAGETKNSWFFRFMAVMVGRRQVDSVILCQGMVGHTHNRQDAIFGHVAKILSRADSLQTPEDFAERVRSKCSGYHVEHITGVLPWKQWLQMLPALSGINQTKWASDRGEEACHSYKLVRREDLPEDVRDLVHFPHPGADPTSDGRDVVMLVKQHMSSADLAQPPFVFVPWSILKNLPEKPAEIMVPRSPFTQRQTAEFLKTAVLLERPEWGYVRAAQYLKDLVKANEDGKSDTWSLPKINVVFEPRLTKPAEIQPGQDLHLDLAFTMSKPLAVMLRPAAAAPAAQEEKNDEEMKGGEEGCKGAPPGFVVPALKGAPGPPGSGARPITTAAKVKATATAKKCLKRPAAAAEAAESAHLDGSAVPSAAAASDPVAAPAAGGPPPPDGLAVTTGRRKRIKIPADAVGHVGCSKCKHNKDVGCTTCRPKLGLIDMGDGKWDWPSAS